jgi:hypothetical protein
MCGGIKERRIINIYIACVVCVFLSFFGTAFIMMRGRVSGPK